MARLEASMMQQERGPARGRSTPARKTILPDTIGEAKLAELLIGRVQEDERAIATLSTAVYRLRTMDADIKQDERGA